MRILCLLCFSVLFAISCSSNHQNNLEDGLKDIFEGDFYIGAALNTSQYMDRDERAKPIIERHFNSITAENDMKWENMVLY